MQLTPATSQAAGPDNYCYWNGREVTQPLYRVSGEGYALPGHIFDNVEDFARRIYNDYGWETAQTSGEPLGPWTDAPDLAYRGNYVQIGKPGFNWLFLDKLQRFKSRFPHIGGVVFGTGVTLDDFVTIDRGGVGDTTIGDYTHIDSHVHVGHNANIGRGVEITAGAIIGGGATLGHGVFVGLGAIIRNKVTVGNNATIGMGAIILEDVPAGETYVGNPGRKLR